MPSHTLPILLASASPRRRELLSLLGLPFSIVVADVDETNHASEPPSEMVQRLSRLKARFVAEQYPAALVAAADTTVALSGKSLGKPADPAEATAMLRALRGRSHQVYSGLTLTHRDRVLTDLVESVVWMRDYSDGEIARYVDSGDPLDKAGAYAIQHEGFHPVARIEGCYASVMGLPLCHLTRALASFGVRVPVDLPAACQAHNDLICPVFSEILDAGERA